MAVDEPGFALARKLFQEYVSSLGFALDFQDFERELAEIATEYGPPGGVALLAFDGAEAAGAVGLRRLDENSCEMKRMYVRPRFRGRGLGRALAERLVAEARRLGYDRMLLDTLGSMREANTLYDSLGFAEVVAYRFNPRPDARYLELGLR